MVVQARDSNGNTLVSAEATATPLLPPVTNFSVAPADAAQSGRPAGTVLTATWDAAEGANQYRLQWKVAGSAGDYQKRRIAAIPPLSFNIHSLTPDTNYQVRISAGHSVTKAVGVWTTAWAMTSAEPAPSGLSASTDSDRPGAAKLEWDSLTVTGKTVSQYVIEYWSGPEMDPGDSGVHIAAGSTVESAYIDGLRPATEYTFRMHAAFTDGTQSPTSNTATWTAPAAAGPPDQPGSVTATPENWETVSVSWTAGNGSGTTGYDVEVQTGSKSGAWNAVPVIRNRDGTVRHDVTKSTLTLYSHGSLSPDTWLRYRVRAINGVGKSAWTTSVAITTPAKPLGFDYDITERYGADGLEVPRSNSSGIALHLPLLLYGRTPVSGATYTLTPEGGGDLPDSVRFNAATNILKASYRDSQGHLIGGVAGHFPLTLVWTATAPDGRTFEQSFTLTFEEAGANGATGDSGPNGQGEDNDELDGAKGSVEGDTPLQERSGHEEEELPSVSLEPNTPEQDPAPDKTDPAPIPPSANAGSNRQGKRGGEVTLSGTGTPHAEGDQSLTYRWRIKSASHAELRAGASWLKNADRATATYHVPRRKDVADRGAVDNGRTITFELTVTDGDGESDTDTVTVTINGSTWQPVTLAVADARADESAGSIAFTVSLSPAARDKVTVDYATADGSAVSGADYTGVEGTLTFQPGQTRRTVSVTLLDDAHDEGEETFTLALSNPAPSGTASITDSQATGTIVNSDPLPAAWLARFGRAAADHAVDAVGARLEETEAGALADHATFAGLRLWGEGATPAGPDMLDPDALFETGYRDGVDPYGFNGLGGFNRGTELNSVPGMHGGLDRFNGGYGAGLDAGTGQHRTLSAREALLGSSFRLSGGGDGAGGARLTAWGRAAATRFDGAGDGVTLNGQAATWLIGADTRRGPWLAGVAVAHTMGDGDYRAGDRGNGELSSSLTAVHPYARVRFNERLSAWALLGVGAGGLTLDLDNQESGINTDTELRMAAAGARWALLHGPGGLQLTGKLDARITHVQSDAETGLAGSAGQTHRLRLAIEGTRPVTLGTTRTLTPTLSLGLRRDGGDAETGAGLDAGAALRYTDTRFGLTVDAAGRALLAHEDARYREWGASATVRIDPGAAGRGFALTLAPAWGAEAHGGAERLWALRDARGLQRYHNGNGMRLKVETAYGLPALRGRALTPYAGLAHTPAGQRWRAGVRWSLGETASLGIEAARRQDRYAATDHGVALTFSLRGLSGALGGF